MFVPDTSVLVYAVDEDSPFHTRCRGLLETWRIQSSPWYLTWGILYEFLRVTYTRDTDFHRFPFLETLDPLA